MLGPRLLPDRPFGPPSPFTGCCLRGLRDLSLDSRLWVLMVLSELLRTTAIGQRLAGSRRQAAGDPMAVPSVHPSSRMSFFLTNT